MYRINEKAENLYSYEKESCMTTVFNRKGLYMTYDVNFLANVRSRLGNKDNKLF